jgi:hypothetical protein
MDLASVIGIACGGLTLCSVVYGAGRIHQSLTDLSKSVDDMRAAMFNGGTGIATRLNRVEKDIEALHVLCKERHG